MRIRNIITTVLSVTAFMAASAHEIADPPVSGLTITVDSVAVTIGMTIDPAEYDMSGDTWMTITPVISAREQDKSASLPSIVISGRTRYYRIMRHPGRWIPSDASLLRAGEATAPLDYKAVIPFESWMADSRLSLDCDTRECCGKPRQRAIVETAVIETRSEPLSFPDLVIVPKAGPTDKTMELSGKAYIDFRRNRIDIDTAYRRNPSELAAIIATIDSARHNPDATITSIEIKGYASPEGSYANNTRLSQGRTVALTGYIIDRYALDRRLFVSSFEPENWAGLREAVISADFRFPARRDDILAIIDSDLEPDARDAAIKNRFPEEYRYILDEIYPALRRSDYTVRYTIRRYTDVDEIRRVFNYRPENLSVDEICLLAASCPTGGKDRDTVVETAARLFPDDVDCNLNAAAVAISRGDYDKADSYLRRVANRGETDYLRGVSQARQGNLDRARLLFEDARDAGIEQAAEAIANLDAMTDGPQVTYIN